MSLACLCLFFGSPQWAQAQGWVAVPCDAAGNPRSSDYLYNFTDGNGFLTLTDITQSCAGAGNSDSYPLNTDGFYPTYPADPNAFPFDGSTIFSSDYSEQYTIGMNTYAPNYGWDDTYTHINPVNGSLATHTTGSVKGYYLWQYQDAAGNPAAAPVDRPMPTTLPVIVQSWMWVWGGVDSGQSDGLVAGNVSASATVSDSLGDTQTGSIAVSSQSQPSFLDAWFFSNTVNGQSFYHVVQVPVVNGIATVKVDGTVDTAADNESRYYKDDPNAPDQVFGSADAYTFAEMGTSVSLIPGTLGGHSTVDTNSNTDPTANWNPRDPRFFSGTNCRVDANGVAVGSTVKKMQVFIGGTLTNEYDDPALPLASQDPAVIYSSGTNQGNVSLTVHFDSTHFADGSQIPIQMIVTDTHGLTYPPVIIKAKTYNKAYALGNDELDGGC